MHLILILHAMPCIMIMASSSKKQRNAHTSSTILTVLLHMGEFSDQILKSITQLLTLENISPLVSTCSKLNGSLVDAPIFYQCPEEWMDGNHVRQLFQVMTTEPGAQRWQTRIETAKADDKIRKIKLKVAESKSKSKLKVTESKSKSKIDKILPWLGVKKMMIGKNSGYGNVLPTDTWLKLIGSGKFSQLTSLDLKNCFRCHDIGLEALVKGCSLVDLNLFGCSGIREKGIIAAAPNFGQLVCLELDSAHTTGDSLTAVAQNCPLLTKLLLHKNHVDEWYQTQWQVLPIPEDTIDLEKLKFGNSVVLLAQQCTKLVELNLSDCSITNISIIALAQHCTQLKLLDLSRCSQIDNASIMALAQNCLQLTRLFLDKCGEITDASVVPLAQRCTQLTELHLYNCDITDTSVVAIAQNCTQLTDLDCSSDDEPAITDTSLVAIAQHCTQIMKLDLFNCQFITDAGMVGVAHHCNQLTDLNLCCCSSITDATVMALSQHCTQLITLDLEMCDLITEASVISIAKRCTKLKMLNVRECTNITRACAKGLDHCYTFEIIPPREDDLAPYTTESRRARLAEIFGLYDEEPPTSEDELDALWQKIGKSLATKSVAEDKGPGEFVIQNATSVENYCHCGDCPACTVLQAVHLNEAYGKCNVCCFNMSGGILAKCFCSDESILLGGDCGADWR